MRRDPGLTTAEIGAFLGISPGAVRTIVHRHGIASTGWRGRAHVYEIKDVVRAAGAHDRILTRRAAEARASLAAD